MKALLIIFAALLPYIAGFLHYEASDAFSHGKWSKWLGIVTNNTAVFVLLAILGVVYFIIKNRLVAGWVVLSVVTAASAGWSMLAKSLEERHANIVASQKLDQLDEWNKINADRVVFDIKHATPYESDTNYSKHLLLDGSVENKTSDKLIYAIIDYTVYNNKKLVDEKRLILGMGIFPTGTHEWKETKFVPSSYEMGSFRHKSIQPFIDLIEARKQFGAGWGWSYKLVGFVPESLSEAAECIKGIDAILEPR